MKVKMILFDLDGTLLPMDNDEFVNVYIKLLVKKAMEWGYEAETMVPAMWKAVGAMVKNDRSRTNGEVFWSVFGDMLERNVKADEAKFETFYQNEFHAAKTVTKENPLAKEAVALAGEKAQHVILATNPLFPPCAVEARLSWIDIPYHEFEMVTNFENSSACKPNPEYYREILEKTGMNASECLMIGNDYDEDIVAARSLGMQTYLVTDHLINRTGAPLDCKHGTFEEMLEFLKKL